MNCELKRQFYMVVELVGVSLSLYGASYMEREVGEVENKTKYRVRADVDNWMNMRVEEACSFYLYQEALCARLARAIIK
jgi:hypothetical protein